MLGMHPTTISDAATNYVNQMIANHPAGDDSGGMTISVEQDSNRTGGIGLELDTKVTDHGRVGAWGKYFQNGSWAGALMGRWTWGGKK